MSMLNGENVELFLVSEQFTSWYWACFVYRIFSISAIYFALIIAVGARNRLNKTVVLTFNLILVVDILLYLIKDSSYGGLVISKNNQVLIITLAALLLLSSLGIFINKGQHKIKAWVYILLLLPTIGISFTRIIYIDDFTYETSSKNNLNFSQLKQTLKNYNYEVDGKELLIPFFSTSCPHCKHSAQKLSISHELNLLPNTVIAFASDSSEVAEFMNTNKLNGIPYVILPIKEMQHLSGFRLPSIFHFSNEKSVQYLGQQFNNLALSKIAAHAKASKTGD
jgi:thiol-disulfide isomerase/thioredoxin